MGLKVDPAPHYQPQKKSKVESGVKYVKGNFFRGRDELDVKVLDGLLARWVNEMAGTREDGTTRRRPIEVFEAEERGALKPLPTKRFETVTRLKTREGAFLVEHSHLRLVTNPRKTCRLRRHPAMDGGCIRTSPPSRTLMAFALQKPTTACGSVQWLRHRHGQLLKRQGQRFDDLEPALEANAKRIF